MTDETVVEQSPEQAAAESNAAFEGGFNTERGSPPPVEKPVEAQEAAPAEAPPPAEEPPPKDEWEGVPAKVRETLESLSSQVGKFPDRLRNIEGHIGGFKSELSAFKAASVAAKAVEQKGGSAPSETQIAEAATSSEKWKRMLDDYPDIAEAVDERLSRSKPQQTVDVEALRAENDRRLQQLEAKHAKELADVSAAVTSTAREFAKLDRKYEDWEDKVRSPAFREWISKQPPDIRALTDSPLAKDADKVLAGFMAAEKAAKGQQAEEKTKRLTQAITPQGKTPARLQPVDDEAAFAAGFAEARG